MIEKTNDYNYTFDVLRVILCLLVIILHVPFSGEIGQVIKAYTRSAVPMFFMLSGFVTYQEGNKERFLRSAKKMLVIGFLSVLLYFVWEIFLLLPNFEMIRRFLYKTVNLKAILVWLVFNETPVGAHLWFLFALAYCHRIGNIFARKLTSKTAVIMSFALILINYFIQLKYYDANIYLTRNWLLIGIPSYLIGIEIKKNYKKIDIVLSRYFSMILLFFVTTLIEYKVLGPKELYLSSFLGGMVLFLFCSVYSNVKIGVCSYLSKLTIYIYIFQLIVLSIVNKILDVLKVRDGVICHSCYSILSFFKPVCIFIICIGSAGVLNWIIKFILRDRRN